MTRKKVTLAYITNDSERKASFKKRKKGLIKKVSELSTLCGVQACCIIYSPFDRQAEVWPSHIGAQAILGRFRKLSEMDQTRKMLNQDSYNQERIRKTEEQLRRVQKDNKRKWLEVFMYRFIAGKETMLNFNLANYAEMKLIIQQFVRDLQARLAKQQLGPNQGDSLMVIENSGGAALPAPAGPPLGFGGDAPMDGNCNQEFPSGSELVVVSPPHDNGDDDHFSTNFRSDIVPFGGNVAQSGTLDGYMPALPQQSMLLDVYVPALMQHSMPMDGYVHVPPHESLQLDDVYVPALPPQSMSFDAYMLAPLQSNVAVPPGGGGDHEDNWDDFTWNLVESPNRRLMMQGGGRNNDMVLPFSYIYNNNNELFNPLNPTFDPSNYTFNPNPTLNHNPTFTLNPTLNPNSTFISNPTMNPNHPTLSPNSTFIPNPPTLSLYPTFIPNPPTLNLNSTFIPNPHTNSNYTFIPNPTFNRNSTFNPSTSHDAPRSDNNN